METIASRESFRRLAADAPADCAAVTPASEVVHGKPPDVRHGGTARTDDERGAVTGVRHRDRPHVGVRFHSEGVRIETGTAAVRNFVAACGRGVVADA